MTINITNKYTAKIKSFIDDKFTDEYLQYKYSDHSLILSLMQSYDDAEIDKIKLVKSTKIKKHADGIRIREIIKDLYNDEILICDYNLNNDDQFILWYRKNHPNINLENMLLNSDNIKYEEIHKKIFDPTDDKKYLYEILYQNSFISLDVIQHAESENLLYCEYKSDNTEIYVYYVEHDEEINLDVVGKIINFIRKIFNKNMDVKLKIFYGKQKKYLYTEKDKFICTDNVNSGLSCVSCNDKSGITIWRKEEFTKVLIHELIHYFGIDFYTHDKLYIDIKNIFMKNYLIDGDDKINESYTELLAILLHSLVYSKMTNSSFDEILSHEILFSGFQLAKILNHFECNKFEDLKEIKIHQTTSVCSYYIVKYLFLLNLGNFLNMWEKGGFYAKKNANKYKEIYDKIVKINNIDVVDNMLKKIKSYITNNFVMKTMRMSMYQLL